jgi:hypothetical protein
VGLLHYYYVRERMKKFNLKVAERRGEGVNL